MAVGLIPLRELTRRPVDPAAIQGYIMAYRQWLPNPAETIGVRLGSSSMNPILPAGSIVAIDRSMTDAVALQGRIVAACPERGRADRWLDLSGRHLILRPSQPGREYPLIPVELDDQTDGLILGQVVWSWSRFGHG
ncbi:MAG: hypothetical protein U0794_07995 [Isosphaeraceae bacterium]